MLSAELQQIMQGASNDAYARRHHLVGIEHVVMAMIARAEPAKLLEVCGAKLGRLSSELDRFLDDQRGEPGKKLECTPELASALQRAANHAQSTQRGEITTTNLLVAMLAEHAAFAVAALNRHGVTRLGVMSYVAHGSTRAAELPRARMIGDWKPTTRGPVPDRCQIVIHDDPYSTMEFVMDVLTSVFDHDREQAHAVMMAAHERGTATVGTYAYDNAALLVAEVTARARRSEFPLKLSIIPA